MNEFARVGFTTRAAAAARKQTVLCGEAGTREDGWVVVIGANSDAAALDACLPPFNIYGHSIQFCSYCTALDKG